ncbi:MAG: phage tail tape measure protein [Deltaproteobacteria bacterium]|nr:phage tail tape measure protein [Deltaproteobacteria bacterium]
MRDMKLFLELIARSAGFKTEMSNSGRAVNRFVQGAKNELNALRQAFSGVTGKLAGLGLGIGTVQQLAASARLDKSLTQIGQTAGEGERRVKGLRKEFFAMAGETGQQVEELRDGFNSLIQSGQSWRAALESTSGINIASAVTGARQEVLAGGLTVGATAFNIDLEKPGKALELLDKMTVAGRLGNAELENLSAIFARVGVNAASAGMGFEKSLAFIEGLSMVERQPERLATLADSTLRVFTNLKYMADAQKSTGVRFFDEKGGRRDPVAVLEDIRKKYAQLKTDQQRAMFIQSAFGKADLDTIKGIKTLLQGDSLFKVRDFTRQIEDAGGTLKRDLPEAVSNAVDQTGRLKSTLRQAADSFAQPINKTLADLIKWALDSKKNGGLGLDGKDLILGGVGLTAGTIAAARYGNKAIGGLAQKLLKSGGSVAVGVAEGKALEAAAGVTPVFVTNMPAGGITPAAPVPGPGGAKGGYKWLAAAGAWSLPVAVVAGPLLSKWYGDDAKANGFGGYTPTDREREVMGIGGRQLKNDITLNVRIDQQGRVFTDTTDMNTRSRVNVKRGAFDGVVMSAGQP